jgi:hypothetical protein
LLLNGKTPHLVEKDYPETDEKYITIDSTEDGVLLYDSQQTFTGPIQ